MACFCTFTVRICTGYRSGDLRISPYGSGSDFYNTNPDPRIRIRITAQKRISYFKTGEHKSIRHLDWKIIIYYLLYKNRNCCGLRNCVLCKMSVQYPLYRYIFSCNFLNSNIQDQGNVFTALSLLFLGVGCGGGAWTPPAAPAPHRRCPPPPPGGLPALLASSRRQHATCP